MPDTAFPLRLLALLGFACLALVYDRRHTPERRYRRREYMFLFGIGATGALFGVIVDSTTCCISPAYFTYGKGLSEGPSFRADVLALGAQAGFSAAAIGAAVLLLVNRSVLGMRRLCHYATFTLLCSGLTASTFGICQHTLQILQFARWQTALGPAATEFTTAWCIHVGAYVGGVAGITGSCLALRRARRVG